MSPSRAVTNDEGAVTTLLPTAWKSLPLAKCYELKIAHIQRLECLSIIEGDYFSLSQLTEFFLKYSCLKMQTEILGVRSVPNPYNAFVCIRKSNPSSPMEVTFSWHSFNFLCEWHPCEVHNHTQQLCWRGMAKGRPLILVPPDWLREFQIILKHTRARELRIF